SSNGLHRSNNTLLPLRTILSEAITDLPPVIDDLSNILCPSIPPSIVVISAVPDISKYLLLIPITLSVPLESVTVSTSYVAGSDTSYNIPLYSTNDVLVIG